MRDDIGEGEATGHIKKDPKKLGFCLQINEILLKSKTRDVNRFVYKRLYCRM